MAEFLPRRLYIELISSVHMSTLIQADIFQECGLDVLQELVLKLKPRVYSPMDYVCRKGDVGKEMYIVKEGYLQVVNADGSRVFATLSKGSIFGGISILNIPGNKNGNRRTANIRSLGYTGLYALSKEDLWEVLTDYPEAKEKLLEAGRKLLKKDDLLEDSQNDELPEGDSLTVEEKLQLCSEVMQRMDVTLDELSADVRATTNMMKRRLAKIEKGIRIPEEEDVTWRGGF